MKMSQFSSYSTHNHLHQLRDRIDLRSKCVKQWQRRPTARIRQHLHTVRPLKAMRKIKNYIFMDQKTSNYYFHLEHHLQVAHLQTIYPYLRNS